MKELIKLLLGVPTDYIPEYRYRPEYQLSQTVIRQKALQSRFISEGVNYPPHPPIPPSCRIVNHWGVEVSRSKAVNINIVKVNRYNIENYKRYKENKCTDVN